ncbi:MAG TPA: hypothetical protein VF541_11605 [Longimicrobium sp.]|jgi:uncharacterized membrane protein YgcG
MARTKRVIQDDFPAGTIDREALCATFKELRDRPTPGRNGRSGGGASHAGGSSASSGSGRARSGGASSASSARSNARG